MKIFLLNLLAGWMKNDGPIHLVAEIDRLKRLKKAIEDERAAKAREVEFIKQAEKLRKELGV